MSSDRDHHKSTPTSTPPPVQPPERVVVLSCRPTLNYTQGATVPWSANPNFTQLLAVPDMQSVVDETNNQLIVDALPPRSDYNNDVLFTILLDSSGLVDPDGNALLARWAEPYEGGAYPVTNPVKGGPTVAITGYCYFCPAENYALGPVGNSITIVPDMVTSRQGGTQITISDQTPNGSDALGFVLGIVLNDANNSYVRIDPIITSKGVGEN